MAWALSTTLSTEREAACRRPEIGMALAIRVRGPLGEARERILAFCRAPRPGGLPHAVGIHAPAGIDGDDIAAGPAKAA